MKTQLFCNLPPHSPETVKMHLRAFVLSILSAPAALAAVNEPCYGSGGVAGITPRLSRFVAIVC